MRGQSPLLLLAGGSVLASQRPCKQLTPIFNEIASEMESELDFGFLNIDSHPNVPVRYGCRGIPFMLFVVNGEVKNTKVGMTSKADLKKFITENLA